MANLLWKQKNRKTKNILSKQFASEDEFERAIFETKEILEDVFLLRRQIRHGKKPGIPDIVGIDNDGNVCVVEMKNVTVDASIIPQVLAYGIWAQENPDAIKNLWRESPVQDEDVAINWDSYQVRIIIIAPAIERSTLQIVNTIAYPVDLIEIKRWVEGGNQFLLVNKLEPEKQRKVRPVRGLETYDQKFYEAHYNKQSVEMFFKYAKETERLVKSKKWPLEMKFNQQYCGFKHGFFNAFGIKWIGTKSFAFFFKLPESVAKKTQGDGVKMDRYEGLWKEAVYRIDPGHTKVKAFLPLFRKSLSSLTGKEA